ncbi:MAG: hypothetical protein AAB480_03595 [Patescibacteria group bacterium]
MRFRRPSEKTVKILQMVGIGVLVVGLGAAPSPRALWRIFRELRMEDTPRNRKWIRRRLHALHEQKYVSVRDERYSLSEIGERVMRENRLWTLSIQKPSTWDGEWHLVVFDIPQQKSRVRIPFVRQLQNLGFAYYQRSVWLHPYPCEDEVREIAIFHDILPFISFIRATHLDGSSEYRKHFKLNTK